MWPLPARWHPWLLLPWLWKNKLWILLLIAFSYGAQRDLRFLCTAAPFAGRAVDAKTVQLADGRTLPYEGTNPDLSATHYLVALGVARDDTLSGRVGQFLPIVGLFAALVGWRRWTRQPAPQRP